MTRDDGGPAFPFTHGPGGAEVGMSLRDWFATHCPPEEYNSGTWGEVCAHHGKTTDQCFDFNKQQIAVMWRAYHCFARYRYADAMLTERAKAEGSTP